MPGAGRALALQVTGKEFVERAVAGLRRPKKFSHETFLRELSVLDSTLRKRIYSREQQRAGSGPGESRRPGAWTLLRLRAQPPSRSLLDRPGGNGSPPVRNPRRDWILDTDDPCQVADASATSASEVSRLELFFDLVFVSALSQLSHHLLEHPSWVAAGETFVLLLAVYKPATGSAR
ncbi:low temperature requirement protein A [Arthrobacter sp. NPDC058130]|uniref:low temperature requirement protein A n=1 Tax=Arthrobacter sp. NPDC058130 TaxID=3346353 RepID=UPI0036EA0002